VTDIPTTAMAVPTRLGVTARIEDGEFTLDLIPQPETLHHGVVRASVLAYVIDAVTGIAADDDPGVWTLTSDLSVRMRPIPAPALISGVSTVVRQGRRSVTCTVELTADGELVATGAAGFVKVPRKETDPEKPAVTPERAVELFRTHPTLSAPLRDEAGVEVVDPSDGVAQLAVTPAVRNPNGTLQGAMVALLAEAATEDLIAARFDVSPVVTDLDIRYLERTGVGPVRTKSRLIGEKPDSPVEVVLTDMSTGAITTLVYARADIVPGP